MQKFLLSIIFGVFSLTSGIATAIAAPLILAPVSNISISGTKTYCNNNQPFVTVNLLINAPDVGRPGIVYVGSHDPIQLSAEFLTDGGWAAWSSAVLPPYVIQRNGLYDMTLQIPLNDLAAKQGWSLYVGYGAYTPKDEALVQSTNEAVAKVRAKFPERQIPTIDPDYYKRTLVQSDMTKNAKYHIVRQWTSELLTLCQPPF